MSATATSVYAVIATWLGTSGLGITAFVKKAKTEEERFVKYTTTLEGEVNLILNEIETLQKLVTPKPAPKPASTPVASSTAKKSTSKKSAAPKKRLR